MALASSLSQTLSYDPWKSETCSPETFLHPEEFRQQSDFARRDNYQQEQYERGLPIGRTSVHVWIGFNGVWSAKPNSGGSLVSYERIGYHSCTADLLRGFIDSGCTLGVTRYNKLTRTFSDTTLQTRKPE
jgi:hypothetical protein